MQLMSFGSVPTQFTLSIRIGAVPRPNVADACEIATEVRKREDKLFQHVWAAILTHSVVN